LIHKPINYECSYAECHYAKCRYAECCYAECRYAERRFAERRYAECPFAPRHGPLDIFRVVQKRLKLAYALAYLTIKTIAMKIA
jgi:hypothetical protein